MNLRWLVLLRKAAVDPRFLDLFRKDRDEAAASIGLTLDDDEIAHLRTMSDAFIEPMLMTIRDKADGNPVYRGTDGEAMLAALWKEMAMAPAALAKPPTSGGARPKPPASDGTVPKRNPDWNTCAGVRTNPRPKKKGNPQ